MVSRPLYWTREPRREIRWKLPKPSNPLAERSKPTARLEQHRRFRWRTVKKDIDLGLELLADILIRPVFPQDFVEKEKERTLSEIASAKDRPQVIAGWAFNELIYQDHPLHRPSHGYPETVQRITREDLLAFHHRYMSYRTTRSSPSVGRLR